MRLRAGARFEKELRALDATQRDRVQRALRLFVLDPGIQVSISRNSEGMTGCIRSASVGVSESFCGQRPSRIYLSCTALGHTISMTVSGELVSARGTWN